MKILDKYIVKKFFTIFPIFIISLVSLICLITYVIDIFVLGNGTTERHGFFRTIYFYFVSTVVTFNIIIPFLAFISSALISLQLANRNEFVSFFSLGISYKRVLKTYFIIAVFLLKLMFVFEFWIMPEMNKIKEELDYEFLGVSAKTIGRNIHIKLKKNRYMYIQYFSKYTNTGENVFVDTIINGKLISRLKAKKLSWNEDRNSWDFYNWEKIEFDDKIDNITKGDKLEVTNIQITPADLIFDETFQTKLNLEELNTVSDRLKKHGLNNRFFKIEQVKRICRPIILVLVVMIGVLFFSIKKRNGNILNMIVGLFLSCFLIISSIICEDIAMYSTLNLYLIFILPILLYCFINYIIYKKLH